MLECGVLMSLTVRLTTSLQCGSILAGYKPDVNSVNSQSSVLLVALLSLVTLLFFIVLVLFIDYVYGVFMAKKEQAPKPKNDFGIDFLNVTLTPERKALVKARYEEFLSSGRGVEDMLLALTNVGKVSLRDDKEKDCYIVSVTYLDSGSATRGKKCVVFRHRDMAMAMMCHLLDFELSWAEFDNRDGGKDDVAW